MHYLAGVSGLDDECGLHTFFLVDEVMVNRRGGEEGGNGSVFGIYPAVGENHVVAPLVDRLLSLGTKALDSAGHAFGAFTDGESHGELAGVEALVAEIAEQVELTVGDYGALEEHHLAHFGRKFHEG